MKRSHFSPKATPYLLALILGLAVYLPLVSIIFIFKPQISDIRPVEPPLEGDLVVFTGGLRSSGSASIGGKSMNLSTDFFGSDSGSAAVRNIPQGILVQAERVSVPTLFGRKTVVVVMRTVDSKVIYEHSADWLIDVWLSSSLGLGALVSFLAAGISYFFIADKLQPIALNPESRPML